MIALYYQAKISISFWCKRGLNPRFLIQPLETLLIELIGIHIYNLIFFFFFFFTKGLVMNFTNFFIRPRYQSIFGVDEN